MSVKIIIGCDSCDAQITVTPRSSNDLADGWRIYQDGHALCPACKPNVRPS